MKVLILNSPIYRENKGFKEEYLPPIGLGYIATQLRLNNIEVELVDCVYKQMGVEEVLKVIEKYKPEILAINIFTQNKDLVKDIIEGYNGKCSLIIGGQVTKYLYKSILEWNTKNDMNIIIGEGEYIIPAIANNKVEEEPIFSFGNKRVYSVSRGSIYFPYDISNIKLFRDFFENREIINIYNKKEAAIVTARGCIYNCAFCGAAKSLNNNISVREREKDSIVNEIEEIINDSDGVESIRILDDLFLKNRTSILKAIDIFSKFKGISWRAMAHILSFNGSLDLLNKLKASGCEELFIGIESGSASIRKSINKLGSIEEIKCVIYKILEAGINVKGYFIYGLLNEELQDMKSTYELAKYLKEISDKLDGKFRCSVFQFKPYHGTELYNRIFKGNEKELAFDLNENLHNNNGRNQFNYQCGNYSNCTQEDIDYYIDKTLQLNNGVKVYVK